MAWPGRAWQQSRERVVTLDGRAQVETVRGDMEVTVEIRDDVIVDAVRESVRAAYKIDLYGSTSGAGSREVVRQVNEWAKQQNYGNDRTDGTWKSSGRLLQMRLRRQSRAK